jgi:transmembrane 9 superfamily protein 2/4
VRHKYEEPWDKAKPRLTTCNPNAKVYVTNSMSPQEVSEGQEIIFTYDVEFEVQSGCRLDEYVALFGLYPVCEKERNALVS